MWAFWLSSDRSLGRRPWVGRSGFCEVMNLAGQDSVHFYYECVRKPATGVFCVAGV